MFRNHAYEKRLENENEYLRKVVDNLLSRLGVEKVSPSPEIEEIEDETQSGTIRFGGE